MARDDVYRHDENFSQGALSWPIAMSESMPRSSTRNFHSCSLLPQLLLSLSSDHIHGATANQADKPSSQNLGTIISACTCGVFIMR